ncbi:LOW QUALITY PROTEIN: ABC transporter C family member 8 [Gossypium raimondii]|uniref:LOW QUALITY PROTEIN: ABC transporter C family member 8 n=1 Tax=Gossypium raimondii TaxID=29730 RepID=UPI00227C19E5|nr:LOW QUALITY PROTEIN: ABC transporter C family member 8 [Gossypium raimondii]
MIRLFSCKSFIQVKVSFDRINTFLLDDELRNDEVRRFPLQNYDKSVTVEAGNFSWVPEIAIPTLRNVELEIKRGQKIAVCRPVGAGKSSILYAMLGEMPKLSGTVSVFGSISYVSQVSWIQSGTIRDNILYGKPMDADKYDKAINACALDKDINSFDHGDITEIGQRGINMSGGQKQRIQLARAVYNEADIYLFDDPFSAVDAHTAFVFFNVKKLHFNCVITVLAKKTVVLVTHQVEFLSEVDRILVMDGGQITQLGSYEELLMAGTTFEQLVNAHRDSITALGSLNGQGEGESRGIAPVMFNECSPTKQNSEGEISVKGPPGVKLTQDEEVEIGDVGWKPFMDYVSISKGSVYLSLSILTQLTFVVLQATSIYWLAFAIQIPNMTNSMLIGVYTGVATLSAVFVFFRSHSAAHVGLKASKAFQSGLTNAIFKAPMLLFYSTLVGRILTSSKIKFTNKQ